MKILLVEDDELTVSTLSAVLMDDRHIINIASDGQTALALANTYEYDLIVLDVQIPQLDGLSVCRKLRAGGHQEPILLLTAKDSQVDKVAGLDAGADDYVVKPFELTELRARIRALLRRGNSLLTPVLTWNNLCLDPNTSEVTCNGQPIALTPKEYALLELFLRNPHRIFSRSAIIDRLWSLEDCPAESAVTTHIKDLRQKLKAGGLKEELIETIYGLGYRLKAAPKAEEAKVAAGQTHIGQTPEERDNPAETLQVRSAQASRRQKDRLLQDDLPQDEPSQEQHQAGQPNLSRVHQVLERLRPTLDAQVAVLAQANAALQTGRLEPELQQQAQREAHKLAGSLGLFGYAQGSQLARELEQLLGQQPLPLQVNPQVDHLVAALQTELHPETAVKIAPASTPIAFRVLLVDDDRALAAQLKTTATAWGMQIELALDLETVHAAIAPAPPDLVLLDLAFSNSTDAGLALLAELVNHRPAIPVLVFTGRDSLADRVAVSRLGGRGFLHKSLPVQQILQTIHQTLTHPQPADAKVLVVDDDPLVLSSIAHLLQPWGLQVTTLEYPQQFWDVLKAIAPDLLVLDLEMPTFSGIDLCQVVRQDLRWGDLPILVVTAHTDATSVQQVFMAGADDFIAKPIVGPELVTRILSRLERLRLRQRLGEDQRA